MGNSPTDGTEINLPIGYSFIVNENFWVALLLTLFLVIVSTLLWRKWKNKELLPEVKELVGASTRPRFRKRDKVLFYGRKIMRKVRSISGQVHGVQGKKRKFVMKFARRLLQLKKDNNTPQQLKVLEPPAEFLQEDSFSKDEQRVPSDAFYLLQSIRVFGHFEKPIFLKLCKHTDILNLPAGAYLFKIGDPDENVYVVQNGRVNVYITGTDGEQISLKIVKTGDSVTSLLSFTDVLTGHPKPYKTVSARALEDSTVVCLPMAAFSEVFREYPDTFIRVMQVIMVRLQRVTFTALHQHLGLSAELVNQGNQKKKNSSQALSPLKSKSKEQFLNKEESFSGQQMTLPDGETQPIPINQHRRSRSGMEIRFTPQPDIMPETEVYSHSQATPDLQAGLGGNGNTRKRAQQNVEGFDEETVIKIATEAFVRELGLGDDSLLKDGKVQIREVPAGTYLMREDSHKDVALVYVLAGTLIVSQKTTDNQDEVHMFNAHPGEVVGGLAVLTAEPSFYTIRAKHTCRIALLSKNTVYGILREKPEVVLHVAHTVVNRLSPFVRQVDFALDWVFLEAGRAVYRQGDESDSTFIVLSGRLRSVITHSNGKKQLVTEYGKGDLVGIVEMVTGTPRGTTVMAIRDSELAKLPEGLFNAIKLRYPIVVTRLINILGHRILGSWQNTSGNGLVGRPPAGGGTLSMDSRPTQHNFTTVAIVPASDDVPLSAFTYELFHSLCAIGPSIRLTSEIVKKTLGATIMEASNEYRLTSWLAQQEDHNNIALYQCDHAMTAWSQRCIRQADCMLIVGLGDRSPAVGKMEMEVEKMAMRTQKELVLLHREGCEPNNTVTWLNNRNWISFHHHILCNKRMFSRKSQYRINELYGKVLMSDANIHSDFSRLARWLTGTSVGLVLGGGGARGASHVGMVKAIQEAGIPIDMVGGVSIGAFMGALWCTERNVTTMTQKAREWSKKMTHWWRQLWDLTWPATAVFKGSYFNNTIYSTFKDTYIEDLWLPYFTVTTDITASTMRIHTHGSLWRYVRASMSLSGYMPPLCDPTDGHLLLDGGYVNNLPADIMKRRGANYILAIDVGSQDDQDLTNYGDDLSGWWLLVKRLPFTGQPIKVPGLPDIQSRLAYVSCVRQLEEVKSCDYCEYIRPPIDKYTTLEFSNFDEIKEVGYNHGKTFFAGVLKGGGAYPPICQKTGTLATKIENRKPNPTQSSSYTLTDLAQMVCKVQRKPTLSDTDSSEDDYEADYEEDAHEVGYVSEPSGNILDSKVGMRRRTGGSLSLSENEFESDSDFYSSLSKR